MAFQPFFPALICKVGLMIPVIPTASKFIEYRPPMSDFCVRGLWNDRWPVACPEEGVDRGNDCRMENLKTGKIWSCGSCDNGRVIREAKIFP